jgi:hypothetical protein
VAIAETTKECQHHTLSAVVKVFINALYLDAQRKFADSLIAQQTVHAPACACGVAFMLTLRTSSAKMQPTLHMSTGVA